MSALDYKLNTAKWQLCTNRHTTTSGYPWGWIENHPNHLCWTGDKNDHRKDALSSKDASDLVAAHNQWLEDSRPVEHKLIDLRNAQATAEGRVSNCRKDLQEAEAKLAEICTKISLLCP